MNPEKREGSACFSLQALRTFPVKIQQRSYVESQGYIYAAEKELLVARKVLVYQKYEREEQQSPTYGLQREMHKPLYRYLRTSAGS